MHGAVIAYREYKSDTHNNNYYYTALARESHDVSLAEVAILSKEVTISTERVYFSRRKLLLGEEKISHRSHLHP